MVEEESLQSCMEQGNEPRAGGGEGGGERVFRFLLTPFSWIKRMCVETHWTFVFGVVSIYGINEGFGYALNRVATDYYMKDVQKVQPSESQIFEAITKIPWIVKPLWGILTDVVPIFRYRRRPYFILAGMIGVISRLSIACNSKLHIVFALLTLTAGRASVAIADVTIDACVAQNSIDHPSLAPDLQSLCQFSGSIGSLLGFSISGILLHLIGPKAVFGFLAIPSGLVCLVGILLDEPYVPDLTYKQVGEEFIDAGKAMWTRFKCPDVWRTCLYMYMSFALSLDIHEGLFYWFTDAKGGPSFSQETVGFIFSVGSVGSLLGVTLYQLLLKDLPFRNLLLWTQLLYGLSGMLDLVLVLRLNLKLGIPDYFLIVIDKGVSQLFWKLKWMPFLVLSTKICPPGTTGTFFALLMSIDNAGTMTSSRAGGLLLHALKVTRTEFSNLWLAVLVRNILRVCPLFLLFLVPREDHNSFEVLPAEISSSDDLRELSETAHLELAPLVGHV